MARKRWRGAAGIPVDAAGGPTIDPTQNVLDLTRAANRRQDDLRKLQASLQDEKIKRVEQMAKIQASYALELRKAEASRVDANRQFDRAERERSAADQLQATRTLEQTWRKTEETLRSMVDTTAKTLALQTAEQVGAVNNRLLALERTSSKDEGKQTVSDPMLAELVAEVRALRKSDDTGSGKKAGSAATWAAVGAIVMLLLALAGFFGLRSSQPEVRYLPAPAQTASPR